MIRAICINCIKCFSTVRIAQNLPLVKPFILQEYYKFDFCLWKYYKFDIIFEMGIKKSPLTGGKDDKIILFQ